MLGGQAQIDRHDRARRIAPLLGQQQGMAGSPELHVSAGIERGGGGVHPLGDVCACENPIERADGIDQIGDDARPRAEGVGEGGENHGRLVLFVPEQADQVVVCLHGALGLDEEGLTALRAIVHDAAHAAARLRTQRYDVATMPDRDEAVGEDALALGVQQPLELGHEPSAAVADLPTHLGESHAGLVGHRAVVIERLAEAVAQVAQPWQCRGPGGEGGCQRSDGAAVRGQPRRGIEDRDEEQQLGAVEGGAIGPCSLQRRADVGNAVERRRAFLCERAARFRRQVQRCLDFGCLGEGTGGECSLTSHLGAGVRSEEGPDSVPLDPASPDSAYLHLRLTRSHPSGWECRRYRPECYRG